MLKKIVIKNIRIVLPLILLCGCSSFNNTKEVNVNIDNSSKQITIRFMSNLPDRTSGQGKIEQFLADQYTSQHPNVKIEFETLQDVAFQERFKAYIASNNIPDIYMTWVSELDFLDKISAELNLQDFVGDGFTPGALETRMRNGKLYGIPTSNDMYLLYYNKQLFNDNDIRVPETYQELLEAIKKFRDKGIIPCATNGKEKWEFSGLVTDLYYRINPDPLAHISNWNNAAYEKDSAELEAAEYFKKLMNAGFFQDNFANTDYGTAKDLFTQGKAAMYYMGTWELGMATDVNLPDSFKKNLAAISMPPIIQDNENNTVLANWYGGGYSVYKDSKVKNEAIDFLKYYFKPQNWAQLVWDNGICVAPQHLRLSGKENELMKSVYNILVDSVKFQGQFPSTKAAGTFGSETKDDVFQQLALGVLSPKQYVQVMDEGLKKGFKEEAESK